MSGRIRRWLPAEPQVVTTVSVRRECKTLPGSAMKRRRRGLKDADVLGALEVTWAPPKMEVLVALNRKGPMNLARTRLTAAILSGMFSAVGVCRADGPSNWVQADSSGKLVYRAFRGGNRIIDFSYAGYAGGGVTIPDVPAKITVHPDANDSANIQKALDDVSQMPLLEGHRGAVLLAQGIYRCDKPLNITTDGVVLRGSTGAILQLTGQPHVAVLATGRPQIVQDGEPTVIADAYVPSGADSFGVVSTAGLNVGDTIQITRPVTGAWVAFMGMNSLVRDGRPERWLSGALRTERAIRAISRNRLTVAPPLCDSYDSRFLNPPGSTVAKVRSFGDNLASRHRAPSHRMPTAAH